MLAALLVVGILSGIIDAYGKVERVQPADCLIVLGSRVRPGGEAGPGLRARALHAARLYRRRLAAKIICTGGRGDYPPTEARTAAAVLRARGIPAGAVVLEEQSSSTYENARYSAEICRRNKWRKVILVTESFHLLRARRHFERQGLKVYGSPAVAPAGGPLWYYPLATVREALLLMRDETLAFFRVL